MNYIELLAGISPDGGSGLTELAIAIALFTVLGLAFGLRMHLKRRTASR